MNRIGFIFFTFWLFGTVLGNWPEELNEPAEKKNLPNENHISMKQANGRSTYETKNNIFLIREDTSSKITQLIDYTFYDDFPLTQKKHYLNLDGELLKKTFPFSFTDIGLDWSPSLLLHKTRVSGLAVGSMRLGPMVKLSLGDFPILIKGGGALDLWNDSLRQYLYKSHLSESNVDGGGYVGVEIGDNNLKVFPKFPLYAHGGIWGTYMSNSNITSGLFNALLFKSIEKVGDLSIYVADTLSKGRLANYSSGNFSTVDYTSSYDRTTNDLKMMVGIKDVGKWYLKPSFLYGLDINTMNYPFSKKNLDEYRTINNSISFFLASKENRYVSYDGGLNFQFYNLDMLYKSDLPDTGFTGPNNIEEKNERFDSLVSNEGDMEGHYVELYNDFYINIFDKVELSYSMVLDRYNKIYPAYYIYDDGRKTVRNNRDEVNYDHEITLFKKFNDKVSLETFFEYKKNMNIFLKAEKSASNNIVRKYLLGAVLLLSGENGSYAKEAIDITNSQEELPDYVKEYLKNEYLAGNDQRTHPYFTRKLSSRFDWFLKLSDLISLSGFWYETFRDRGYWDIETWKKEVGLGTGKYIIEHKHIETNIQGILIVSPIRFQQYKVGANLQNIINYVYSKQSDGIKRWAPEPKHLYRFNFNPFVEFKFLINERFLLNGNVKCNSRFNIDTYNEKKGEREYKIVNANIDFWEAGTALEVHF